MLAHTRTVFDQDLTDLARLVGEMGTLVEGQIDRIATAFADDRFALLQDAVQTDENVDKLCAAIEAKSVEIIARRQPFAVDLRETISPLQIAHDLERIGHLAKNISKRILNTPAEQVPVAARKGLETLTKLVQKQLRAAIDSYMRSDATMALKVWNEDEQIDVLHNSQFQEILNHMAQDSETVPACMQLLFCVKNLERAGDHTTNIAETVHYLVTGHLPEGQRPKRDTTSFELGST